MLLCAGHRCPLSSCSDRRRGAQAGIALAHRYQPRHREQLARGRSAGIGDRLYRLPHLWAKARIPHASGGRRRCRLTPPKPQSLPPRCASYRTPLSGEAATPHASLSPPARTSRETLRAALPRAWQTAGVVLASGRGQLSAMPPNRATPNTSLPNIRIKAIGLRYFPYKSTLWEAIGASPAELSGIVSRPFKEAFGR